MTVHRHSYKDCHIQVRDGRRQHRLGSVASD